MSGRGNDAGDRLRLIAVALPTRRDQSLWS